jgi:hypothetical protein
MPGTIPKLRKIDEIHIGEDTGISSPTVQKDMRDIFLELQSAVGFFHTDSGCDRNGKAMLLNDSQLAAATSISGSSVLCSLYDTLLGTDRETRSRLHHDEIIGSFSVLLGLLGTIIYQHIFTKDVDVPVSMWDASTNGAIQQHLDYDGKWC